MKIYKDFVLFSQVDLNTMTNVQCSSPPILWKPRTQITDNMICASDAGKSACLGDTGGPLVTDEGKYYIDLFFSLNFGYSSTQIINTNVYLETREFL